MDDKELLQQALEEEYLMKASWVYNKIHELGFYGFEEEIKVLIDNSSNYDWKNSSNWEISNSSRDFVIKSNLPLIQIFCHPKVLVEHPRLLAYYRSVATLSQKGLTKLATTHPKQYEIGQKEKIPFEKIKTYAKYINLNISAIIDNATQFNINEIKGLLFVTAGAQIDGSWKNEKGDYAEFLIKRMIMNYYNKKNQIVSYIDENNNPRNLSDLPDPNISIKKIKGLKLANKHTILYSSEPDTSIINPNADLIVAIEIKGGNDTAGALERYGAALKSLDESIKENENCYTMLIASVGTLTTEVKKRLKSQKTIKRWFNLTRMIKEDTAKKEFFTSFDSFMN